MYILYNIYNHLQQGADQSYLNKNKKDEITGIKRYMDEHFNQSDLSVSVLAEQIGISEVYFRKLFKAQYGISPSKHLISVRLKNAQKLMRSQFLTLEECALQSGFSSLQYFCRLFKKETGITPGQDRKDM